MNVSLKYSKEIKETEISKKIKKDIQEYVFFVYLRYLEENKDEKALNELKEISEKLELDNPENINYYKDIFDSIEDSKYEEKEISKKKISNIINEVLKESELENDYILGKKSTPVSKELEINMI